MPVQLSLEKLIGSSLGQSEAFPAILDIFAESTTESVLLAAEALLPMKPMAGLNWKRAALIGGTWLAHLEALMHFSILRPREKPEDQAWNLLGDDAKKRTDGSMNEAIDKFAALGVGDESSGLRGLEQCL